MYEALHFAPPIENFGKVWIVAGFKIYVSTCFTNNLMPISSVQASNMLEIFEFLNWFSFHKCIKITLLWKAHLELYEKFIWQWSDNERQINFYSSIYKFKRSPMGLPAKLGTEHASRWHHRSWPSGFDCVEEDILPFIWDMRKTCYPSRVALMVWLILKPKS